MPAAHTQNRTSRALPTLSSTRYLTSRYRSPGGKDHTHTHGGSRTSATAAPSTAKLTLRTPAMS